MAQGLSEPHEAVLAALRIRLKGSAGKSLEEMLEAADDAPPDRLGEAIAKAESKGKPSLDDLLGKRAEEARLAFLIRVRDAKRAGLRRARPVANAHLTSASASDEVSPGRPGPNPRGR